MKVRIDWTSFVVNVRKFGKKIISEICNNFQSSCSHIVHYYIYVCLRRSKEVHYKLRKHKYKLVCLFLLPDILIIRNKDLFL